MPLASAAMLDVQQCCRQTEGAQKLQHCADLMKLAVTQDELVELRHMKPEADAALQQKSAAQAARAARRHKTEARKEFRSAITPNGLQVSHFPELLH